MTPSLAAFESWSTLRISDGGCFIVIVSSLEGELFNNSFQRFAAICSSAILQRILNKGEVELWMT